MSQSEPVPPVRVAVHSHQFYQVGTLVSVGVTHRGACAIVRSDDGKYSVYELHPHGLYSIEEERR